MRHSYIKRKAIVVLFLCLIFISVMSGFIFRRLEKPFEIAFSAYASEIGNEAISNAVSECFSNISYNELVYIKTNSQNEIVSFSANTVEMNKIKSELNSNIKKHLNSNNSKKIKLFAGSAQSNPMLSALGPKITVKVKPYTLTKSSFKDKFQSAGINQVRHCIYIDVCATITVASLYSQRSYDVKNTLLVADTVIVGRVPQFQAGNLSGINDKLE